MVALTGMATSITMLLRSNQHMYRSRYFFHQLNIKALAQKLRELKTQDVSKEPSTPQIQVNKGDVEKELLYKNSALLRANRSLVQSRTQLRRLVEKLYDIKEKEGIRVARELHDELGQILTGLKIEVTLLLRNIQKTKPDDEIVTLASETLSLVGQSILRVQKLSKDLRPPMLDKLGLIDTFEAITQEVSRQTHVQCRLEHQVFDETLSTEVLTYAYRVFKETIFALASQSEVTKVTVWVEKQKDEIAIKITDDGGNGTRHELFKDGSIGILGMTEYARKYGGTFSISQNKTGTEVTVLLPTTTSSMV